MSRKNRAASGEEAQERCEKTLTQAGVANSKLKSHSTAQCYNSIHSIRGTFTEVFQRAVLFVDHVDVRAVLKCLADFEQSFIA